MKNDKKGNMMENDEKQTTMKSDEKQWKNEQNDEKVHHLRCITYGTSPAVHERRKYCLCPICLCECLCHCHHEVGGSVDSRCHKLSENIWFMWSERS